MIGTAPKISSTQLIPRQTTPRSPGSWPTTRPPVRGPPHFSPRRSLARGGNASWRSLVSLPKLPRLLGLFPLYSLSFLGSHVIDRIHRAIREGAERFMRDGTYEMAWPAVLAAARKPLS